jgi:hypothetical protein
VDENVEFPPALSDLPNPPSQLAVDRKSGDLWFVMFLYGGGTNDLYHYSAADGTLEKRPIPASTGSEFFSAIAVDARGHVILAEGDTVLDIDPEGDYKALPLPAPANFARQPGWDGTYVIDMALSEDGKAYLTRMNTAAVTEVNIASGEVREIPVPPRFGQMYFLELAEGSIWMTGWVDTAAAPSQTIILDLKTGDAESQGMKTAALAAAPGGEVYLSRTDGAGLSRAAAAGSRVDSLAADEGVLGRGLYFLAVDAGGSTVWMAADSSGAIVSLESSSGASARYDLPSWNKTTWISVPIACIVQPCPTPRGSVTRLGDIAVAPNGDLYFSDMSFNRIGVVHPR